MRQETITPISSVVLTTPTINLHILKFGEGGAKSSPNQLKVDSETATEPEEPEKSFREIVGAELEFPQIFIEPNPSIVGLTARRDAIRASNPFTVTASTLGYFDVRHPLF
jgi:hypothetical protein